MRRIATRVLALLVMLTAAPARADEPAGVDPVPANLRDAHDAILEHIQRDDLSEEEVRTWIQFANDIKENAKSELSVVDRLQRAVANPWVFFGFAAQAVFMMRFVVQLIASERKKRSYVPVAFWYLSLAGGLMLLAYALVRRDPVFVFGQALGIVIYARNLMLIYRRNTDLDERLSQRDNRAGESLVRQDTTASTGADTAS